MKAIDQKQDPAVDAINERLKNIRFKATAGQHKVARHVPAAQLRRIRRRACSALVPGGGQDRVLQACTSFEVRGPFAVTGVSDTPSREHDLHLLPADGGRRAAVRDADRRHARDARVPPAGDGRGPRRR